jgi:hypothetical protein
MSYSDGIVGYASSSTPAFTSPTSSSEEKCKEIIESVKDYTSERLVDESDDFSDMDPEQICDEIFSMFVKDVFSTRYFRKFYKIQLKNYEEAIKIAIYEVVMNWVEVRMMLC